MVRFWSDVLIAGVQALVWGCWAVLFALPGCVFVFDVVVGRFCCVL